jgi:hypothetical protein
MNPWIAKTVILAASVVMVVIRVPHGRRSRGVKVARSCKGPREVTLLTLAWMWFLVPLIWVASPVFSFAEYSLRPWPFGAGVVYLVEASGGSTGHTRTWARTGRSPLNCAEG